MRLRSGAILVLLAAAAWGQRPLRLPSRGTRGAVAGGSEYATEAGMRMYFSGGNAVDAGVATMLAASVAEFSHFGLGGEAPILIRTREGKVYAIAGVGTMPKLATADFFRNHQLTAGRDRRTARAGGLKDWVPVAGSCPRWCPAWWRRRWWRCASSAPSPSPRPSSRPSNWRTASPSTRCAPAPSRAAAFLRSVARLGRVFLPDGQRAAGPAKSSASRTWRARCAPWRTWRRRRWPRAPAAPRPSTPCATISTAARSPAASTRSRKQQGGLLRYEDMAAFRVQAGRAGLHHFPRLHRLQAGLLEPGAFHDRGAEHPGGLRPGRDGLNSAEYIHTLVEALKLAYADRDTYYGDPKFVKIPADALLSKEYGAERRKLIGARSLARVPAGQDLEPNPPQHPLLFARSRTTSIDDALMAKDTTCVDAIDKDGVAILGHALRRVDALADRRRHRHPAHRARAELPADAGPSQRTGRRQAAARHSQPHPGGEPGQDALSRSPLPAATSRTRPCCRCSSTPSSSACNAEQAIETPRFQSEHLVSSFDNHEMHPGLLLLDERIPPAVADELRKRRHLVEIRSRYDSGSAPVMIRLHPDGMIEAGADPFYYRVAQAW